MPVGRFPQQRPRCAEHQRPSAGRSARTAKCPGAPSLPSADHRRHPRRMAHGALWPAAHVLQREEGIGVLHGTPVIFWRQATGYCFERKICSANSRRSESPGETEPWVRASSTMAMRSSRRGDPSEGRDTASFTALNAWYCLKALRDRRTASVRQVMSARSGQACMIPIAVIRSPSRPWRTTAGHPLPMCHCSRAPSLGS